MSKFTEPTEEDWRDLAAKEDWVAGHYPEDQRASYEHLGAKLVLLQTIVDHHEEWIEADDPQCALKRQCLGATFGAGLVQYYHGLAWKVVDDEYGRDLCLVYLDTSIQVNPLTILSKRLEDGEEVNVKQLFVDTCKWLDKVRKEI